MRAVARGKAEHEASHTVMALHYGQAIRAVTIDPAEGGQGAMYRWQAKETHLNALPSPGFRCSFRPDMPPSLTSGSSIIVSVQNTDVDIGLRHGPKGSALPIIPQSVSRGARFSRLRWFATATACQVAGPPVRI